MDNPDIEKRRLAEFHFHVAIADWLHGRNRKDNWKEPPPVPKAFPGLMTSHFATGRNGDESAFLQMMGLRAGMPDIPNFWRHPQWEMILELGRQAGIPDIPITKILFLELKQGNNDINAAQNKIRSECAYHGIPYETAWTAPE